MRLCIQVKDLEAIATAAASAFPEECCGLLVGESEGDDLVVARIVAAANVANQPHRCFEVDPATLLKAYRCARAEGQVVIGHYHSHPGGIAVPSAYDLARAFAEGEVWLIVPVDRTAVGTGAARAHLFTDGAFHEIEIAPGP